MLHNIPIELKRQKAWIGYKLGWDYEKNKHTKTPINLVNGFKTWKDEDLHLTFFDAVKSSVKVDGYGYIFKAPYIGVDQDNNLDQDVIRKLGSYSEYSVSKKGYHIIVKGELPKSSKTKKLELYTWGRWFAMTGNLVPGFPRLIKTVSTQLKDIFDQNEEEKVRLRNNGKPFIHINEQLRNITAGDTDKGRTPTFVSVVNKLRAKNLTPEEIYETLSPWADKHNYTNLEALIKDQYERYPDNNEAVTTIWDELQVEENTEWIVDGLISKKSIGFVAGLPESKKTFLLMDLAIEAARV